MQKILHSEYNFLRIIICVQAHNGQTIELLIITTYTHNGNDDANDEQNIMRKLV
jgi:hypothetical protein